MKRLFALSVLFAVSCSKSGGLLQDLEVLKSQRQRAIKPIEDRYLEGLQELLQKASQAGDGNAASSIREALQTAKICQAMEESIKNAKTDKPKATTEASRATDQRVVDAERLAVASLGSHFAILDKDCYTALIPTTGFRDSVKQYVQLKGQPELSTTVFNLTEADHLNGVSWIAMCRIHFAAYRKSEQKDGRSPMWTEWEAIDRRDLTEGFYFMMEERNGTITIKSTHLSYSIDGYDYDQSQRAQMLPDFLDSSQ